MILSGAFVTGADLIIKTPDIVWKYAGMISADMQFLGALIGFFYYVPYKQVRLKTALFFLCVWRTFVLVYNPVAISTEHSIYFIMGCSALYCIWLYRLGNMKKIQDQEPPINEAYYVLSPINSYRGLLQAVFLPWHPARYETRILVDGNYVYSINKFKFNRSSIQETDIDIYNGVRKPIGRRLTKAELIKLNSIVGKPAITGLRDCRKFLVSKV